MADTNKGNPKGRTKKASKKKTENTVTATPTPVISTSPITTQSSAVSGTVISESDQKRLQEMVMLANLEYSKLKNKVLREKKREIDSLDGQIKEFLGAYMLIGYDLNNNPVEIISAGSTAENDALLERFRRVMFKINQNIANSNGDDPFGNNN